MAERSSKLSPWVLRGLWVALPFVAGPALAAGLHGYLVPQRSIASVLLWLGWAIGVGCTFVAHPATLTGLRVLTPAAPLAVVLAVARDGASPFTVAALVWSLVTAASALSAAVAARWVNGPAYPNERRLPLRIPGPLVFGGLPLTWALTVAGIASGPLLLAARSWVVGAVALIAGVPTAVVAIRSTHILARRWAVFVPAGLVLHDPLALMEPVLFPRQAVVGLGPAPVDTVALDLSQRSLGLALELELNEPFALNLMKPGNRLGEPIEVSSLLFSPARPGVVLEEAATRRLGTGRRPRRGQTTDSTTTPPPSTSSPR